MVHVSLKTSTNIDNRGIGINHTTMWYIDDIINIRSIEKYMCIEKYVK